MQFKLVALVAFLSAFASAQNITQATNTTDVLAPYSNATVTGTITNGTAPISTPEPTVSLTDNDLELESANAAVGLKAGGGLLGGALLAGVALLW